MDFLPIHGYIIYYMESYSFQIEVVIGSTRSMNSVVVLWISTLIHEMEDQV